jgi:hypothetical protein
LGSHGFFFDSNREGARAVGTELHRRGFERVWVGEEMTGDDCGHVVGWCRQPLTHRVVSNVRRLMGKLAKDTAVNTTVGAMPETFRGRRGRL